MPLAQDPAHMTADERLDEVSSILSAGIKRLQEKRKTEKISLDKSPTIRPYGRKSTRRENRHGE